MSSREFHFSEGASNKFWTISVEGTAHTVRFGRLGTAGQVQTKEFATEADARKSADKLIAEKLKKGYVEQSAAGAPTPNPAAPTPASTPRPPAKAKPPAPEPVKPESPAETVAGVPDAPFVQATRSLDLSPDDWLWATWRPRVQRPRPEARPFDLDDAAARLSKVTVTHYGWVWAWEKASISPTLTREEAHFWALALSTRPKELKPKDLARHLVTWARGSTQADGPALLESLRALGFFPEEGDPTAEQRAQALQDRGFTGSITLEQIARRAERQMAHTPGYLIRPLVNLFPLEEVVEWLLALDIEERAGRTEYRHFWRAALLAMSESFGRLVTPHLSDEELEAVRRRVRPHLDVTQCNGTLPIAYFLAADLREYGPLRELVESCANSTQYLPVQMVFGLGDPQLVELHMRRLKLRLDAPELIRAWLAHTEYGALDLVRDAVLTETNKDEAEKLLAAFARVKAPEAAPYMLELMTASKAGRGARQWLDDHPEHAIPGLIPVAAGRGKSADAAAEYLLAFSKRGGEALLKAALEHASPETAEKVRAAVFQGEDRPQPLDDASTPAWLTEALAAEPKSKKALTAWVSAADLPSIAIGDHSLNDAQVEAVLSALARDPLGEPGPLLQALRRNADRRTLDRFAWRLFELWLADGAAANRKWAMSGLGHLGADPSALKLAPMIRAWPGESQHQRAVLGLECLRAIGTDTALMQISGIAQKVPFKGLKAKASECMEAIAQDRGLTRPQLEDRIVPTCELDERGSRDFDFGPRKFRLVISPDLKPVLREADGKLRPDLPKPTAKDDPALAAQAVAEWKLLKKQVAEVAKTQAIRLEQAMVTGRRWPREDFVSLLVRHPLMTNLVRMLVWSAYDADGRPAGSFRVTEDQTFADRTDEDFVLDDYTQVGVAHPLQLTDEEKQVWGDLFSDYEILSPFPQLGRPTFGLQPSERGETELKRWTALAIPPQSLVFTLEKLDWQRGIPEDAGVFHSHSKPFYGAQVTAVVEYDDGVPVGYMEGWDDQKITRCYFVPGIWRPEMYPDHKERIRLSEIDPIVISEVLGDLTTVASKAK